jgi:hypothetical protein
MEWAAIRADNELSARQNGGQLAHTKYAARIDQFGRQLCRKRRSGLPQKEYFQAISFH